MSKDLSSQFSEQLHLSKAPPLEEDGPSALSDKGSSREVQPSSSCQVGARQTTPQNENQTLILCDMGYGLPNEVRPRREKLLAIARQLVNFLKWQQASCGEKQLARIRVVSCPDSSIRAALEKRMLQLWHQECNQSELPENFSTSLDQLEKCVPLLEPSKSQIRENDSARSELQKQLPVYLSPDADNVLDVERDPPSFVVVALLIDRRIQVNRSLERATKLTMPMARWPLELASEVLDRHEPLNVDCILEALQQWKWNYATLLPTTIAQKEECLQTATIQALEHHQQRHPSRPRHKEKAAKA